MKKGVGILVLLLLLSAYSCKSEKGTSGQGKGAPGEGTEAGEATVTIMGQAMLAGEKDHTGIFVYLPGTSYLGVTDEKGFYEIRNVPAGVHKIRAQKEGYVEATLDVVELQPATGEPPIVRVPSLTLEKLEPRESALKNAGSVMGVVKLKDATDFSGVIVEVKDTPIKTVTDANGIFRILNLEPQKITIRMRKTGYKDEEVSVNVVPGSQVSAPGVELTPVKQKSQSRKVFGTVEMFDTKGKPLNKFSEVLLALEGTSYVATPDAQGRFTFTGVPPGRYVISAAAPGFLNRSKIDIDLTELEYTNVTVYLDENPEEKEKVGRVKGVAKLADQEQDASGITIALAGTSFVALTDYDGNYVISKVPEGRYTVLAQAEGYVPAGVENVGVTASEETSVEEIVLEKKVTLPEVVFTDPADGARQVMVRRSMPIFVRFNKKMRPETVKAAFSIKPEVECEAFMGKENPQSDFDLLLVLLKGVSENAPARFRTPYTVTIGKTATDFENLQMENPYVFKFTTGEASIIRTVPGQGERNVFLSHREPFVIYFNATIRHDSVSPQTIKISPEPYGEFYVQNWDDQESGWTESRLYTSWEFDQEYTVTITRGIRTFDGSSLGNTPYTVTFTTTKRYELIPYSGEQR
jgi:hypothetical protein